MILKKPYGFLIKHFKLIHLIMTILMGILLYQTNTLLNFFNDFMGSAQSIVGTDVISTLVHNYIYVLAIIIVLATSIIFVLMSFKDKPRIYYVLTIIGYILLIVLYIYTVSTIKTMQVSLVDERITRAIRDFLNIMFVFQIYTFFISLIRSIGLDVKKFDFSKDVQYLNITDQDSEEFEVNVEFDSHNLKRKLRRSYRNFRYYFIENKTIILSIIALVICLISFLIIISFTNHTVSLKLGQVFSPVNYNIIVTDGYVTSKDYRLNNITSEDKSLVVIKVKIKTPNKTSKFIYGKLALQIDNQKYYHTYNYASKLTDLGETYINQNLTEEYQEYLLVYEIPSDLIETNMNLVYTEQIVKGMFGDKTDDVKIKFIPTNLNQLNKEENISVGQNYIVGEGLLSGYEFKINNVDLANSFNINYRSCVQTNECYNFYEVVQPTLTGISDKAILKLDMSLNKAENGNISDVKSLITKFGGIEYKMNDDWQTSAITKMIDVEHSDGNYYFEIKKEVLDASDIYLTIKVRGISYKIVLK